MQLGKLAERTTSESRKDSLGKEIFPGDILLYPISNSRFEFGIIENFTPKGMNVITNHITKRVYIADGKDTLNMTDRLNSAEIEKFEDLRKAYKEEKIQEKKEKVISKFVFAIVRDPKDLEKFGFCYFQISSEPGKAIPNKELENFKITIEEALKDYSVFYFSKYYALRNKLTDECICSELTYNFYSHHVDHGFIYWAVDNTETKQYFGIPSKYQIAFDEYRIVRTFSDMFITHGYSTKQENLKAFLEKISIDFFKKRS